MYFKLYFRYGTMNASKSANLLMIAHNYETQNKKVLILKPEIDTRSSNKVSSRVGIEREADLLINESTNLSDLDLTEVYCILVDESQFLLSKHVDELRALTKFTPVICYGLKTDYRTKLFPGSKRLLELADSIEEIKTICVVCNKKSIINAKFQVQNTKKTIIRDGSELPDIGAEEKYQSMCWWCWNGYP